MKQLMGSTVIWLVLAGTAFGEPQQTTIEVSGLTCPSCPFIAVQAVEAIEGVKVIGGEYDEQAQQAIFIVSYDDEITDPQAIATAPQGFGYPARILDGPLPGS
jgi:periplasmic mercuric ion binding protein